MKTVEWDTEYRHRSLCPFELHWLGLRVSSSFPCSRLWVSACVHFGVFMFEFRCWGFSLFSFFFFFLIKKRCVYFWQGQKRSADIFLPVLLNCWFFPPDLGNTLPVDKTVRC